MKRKAIVLLSGGLDSLTCLAIAKAEGFVCYALSFDYHQRSNSELEAAKKIAQHYQVVEHKILPLAVDVFAGSALTDKAIDVPEYKDTTDIPVTYVPARNTVFLANALAYAEVIAADTIVIGAHQLDYSRYPDCRPEYMEAFQRVINLATKATVEGHIVSIYTPLIHWSKSTIIEKGVSLGVDYSMSVSCYQADAQGNACGTCDPCYFRRRGFLNLGLPDPTRYQ